MKARAMALAVMVAMSFAGYGYAAETVDVKAAGAKGDGKTLDTEAIQKAIDDVSAKGGGTVNVPAGKYMVATVILKDNVTLHLAMGATLIGTDEVKLYKNVDPFKDGLGADVGSAMIVAKDAKHVTIEGDGIIDGNGAAIAKATPFKGQGWGVRPFLVRLIRCDDVTLRGIQLREAGSWTTNLFECKNITIDKVTIYSRGNPHNDGIDIDSCQKITITGCDIDSGDDAVCLKSTSATPCTDITVSDCKLKSSQGAIKLGTESYGGFENVKVSKCDIRDTRNGGIKVLCVDGGTLKNIEVSDITMDNVKTPIFVRLGARLKTFRDGLEKRPPGVLQNVVIRNVKAKAAADAQVMPPSGIYVIGIPDHKIEGLTLENIDISLAGGGTAEDAKAVVEEKIDSYPEVDRFGKKLPAYGLYARHVSGLTAKNISFSAAKPDLRPAVWCEDVDGMVIDHLKATAQSAAECVIRVIGKDGGTVSNDEVSGKPKTLILHTLK